MTTALVLKATDQQIAALESLAQECQQLATREASPFRKTFSLAAGMAKLGELITADMMTDIMALQGSSLGFKTDKDDKGGYPLDTVKAVTIEATLRGLRMIGNEVNIIAGRFYAAKEGLRRLIQEWPSLSNLRVRLSVPRIKGDMAEVDGGATWLVDGEEHHLDRTGNQAIAVRVNKGMIIDAILGKARRKLYAAILEDLAGVETWAAEQTDPQAIDVPAEPVQQIAGPTADPAEQTKMVGEYKFHIDKAEDAKSINGLAKAAATDKMLTAESVKTINTACNEKRKALKEGKKP